MQQLLYMCRNRTLHCECTNSISKLMLSYFTVVQFSALSFICIPSDRWNSFSEQKKKKEKTQWVNWKYSLFFKEYIDWMINKGNMTSNHSSSSGSSSSSTNPAVGEERLMVSDRKISKISCQCCRFVYSCYKS